MRYAPKVELQKKIPVYIYLIHPRSSVSIQICKETQLAAPIVMILTETMVLKIKTATKTILL